ncbi:hypothetical protein AYO46_10595 [Betaproteobacteria bacterium SCGC AG-212-J23]|nr:hypothetical protein AYO46_10595 [Betaproteobacteria bacterium SCGC AG-212-J23]
MALRIEVVYAQPDGAQVIELRLADGATVADALTAAAIRTQRVGIFGKTVKPDRRLADGDRVEVYRPLRMDPKEARRRRARR